MWTFYTPDLNKQEGESVCLHDKEVVLFLNWHFFPTVALERSPVIAVMKAPLRMMFFPHVETLEPVLAVTNWQNRKHCLGALESRVFVPSRVAVYICFSPDAYKVIYFILLHTFSNHLKSIQSAEFNVDTQHWCIHEWYVDTKPKSLWPQLSLKVRCHLQKSFDFARNLGIVSVKHPCPLGYTLSKMSTAYQKYLLQTLEYIGIDSIPSTASLCSKKASPWVCLHLMTCLFMQ